MIARNISPGKKEVTTQVGRLKAVAEKLLGRAGYGSF